MAARKTSYTLPENSKVYLCQITDSLFQESSIVEWGVKQNRWKGKVKLIGKKSSYKSGISLLLFLSFVITFSGKSFTQRSRSVLNFCGTWPSLTEDTTFLVFSFSSRSLDQITTQKLFLWLFICLKRHFQSQKR